MDRKSLFTQERGGVASPEVAGPSGGLAGGQWAARVPTILTLTARPVRTIAAEALELPEEDRLALASELIDSVEGVSDPEWEAAWLRELDARDAQGSAQALPWTEVRNRILERLKKS